MNNKAYIGKLISVNEVEIVLPNNKKAQREIVNHPGSSAIIAINDNKEIYMINQYRAPLDKMSIEIPAGILEPKECPMKCAIRELKEETGLTAINVKHLLSVYSSPGFCNEIVHIFLATKLKQESVCLDDDEYLFCQKIKMDKLIDMIINGEINDSKSIIGILFAEKIMREST